MKVVVRDPTAFKAIRPLELAAYLHATGWHEASQLANGLGSVWTLPQGDDSFEILLPLRATVRDYLARMSDAVHTLAIAENRSELEVLGDLSTTSADVVRVRVQRDDLTDGTIAVEEGVQLVQRVHELVLAAACAAVRPQRYFPNRKPTQAVEYMRRQVRLGQTEQGSYAVTLISRLPPALSAAELFSDPAEPFERRVTRTLTLSLEATQHAAERAAATADLAPFQDAVAAGFSANLGDALAGISADPSGSLQIDITWSRVRSVPAGTPSHVIVAGDALPIIREAGRLFRESAVLEDYELYGLVTRLERAQAAGDGRVTITTILENPPRQIGVSLDGGDYNAAIQAHAGGVPVMCRGELRKEGRTFVLRHAHGFTLAPLDEAGV